MDTAVLEAAPAAPVVDLSPIAITQSLLSDGSLLVLKKSLVLKPTLAGDGSGMLEVADLEAGLDTYGETREELLEAIADDIDAIWFHYANPATSLTRDAERIGRWWRGNAHIDESR